MKEIADYTILESSIASSLAKLVKEHIDQGYQPYGSLNSFAHLDRNSNTDKRFYQPMVKYCAVD